MICVQDASEWHEGKLLKLHVQMGHADSTLIHRMLTLSKQEVGLNAVRAMNQKCGCLRDDSIPQAPRLNRYRSVVPGEEIFLDIYLICLKSNMAGPKGPDNQTVGGSK